MRLSGNGDVWEDAEDVAYSCDRFRDDNAVRTLQSASPLPAAPKAGIWPFAFPSEDR